VNGMMLKRNQIYPSKSKKRKREKLSKIILDKTFRQLQPFLLETDKPFPNLYCENSGERSKFFKKWVAIDETFLMIY